jgi:signal transduction histidine kinase/DNA-binding response OmpR family regulator
MNESESNRATPRRGVSLVFRFSATASAVVVIVMSVMGWINFTESKRHLTESWHRTLEHEGNIVALKIAGVAGDVARDALYLAHAQPVVDFANDQTALARERVESDFRALMAGKPGYMQVRIVAASDEGMEMVRLDRSGNDITTTPLSRLQPKGDRDYIRAGARLGDGEVYLSDIDLNRDFGGISKPYTPTMRAVAKAPGTPSLLVVINVDLTTLFSELQSQRAERTRLYVANNAGSWLLHPRADALYGTDLGHGWSAANQSADDLQEFAKDSVFSSVKQALVPGSGRSIFVRTASAGEIELEGLRTARNSALLFSGTAALAGIVVLILLARWTTARLRRVVDAIGEFGVEKSPRILRETTNDEVGHLAAGFNAMTEKIAAQVAAIESARADAVEASRAKEEFFAVMSHEIRTPLNAVTGLLRLLARNNPAPHQAPVLRSLNAAAQQLTALFNGVLDWSKLRAGKMEVQAEPFALRQLLEDVALVHRPLAVQKGLAFSCEISPAVPPVAKGDGTRLSQILHNLLNNAVKFTSEGHVALRVDWHAGQLTGEVSDTGVGVPEEARERIFAPFDQAGASQRFGGTGLGLSITRSLLELQGGTIRVEPGENGGSRFIFQLPCDAAEQAPEAHSLSVTRFEGLRILYVEDTASNREVMSALIGETGAILEMAETGNEGLEMLRARDFDIALFDLQLPDMSGTDLARETAKIRPELPIFAVTAQMSEAAQKECTRAGMRGAVAKPIIPAILFATLRTCATHSPAPQQNSTNPGLRELFSGEQLRRVLHAVAGELRKAQEEVRQHVSAQNVENLRRTRHRLHSAICQLQLDDLDHAMQRLINGEWDALEPCLAELEKASAATERDASA